MNSGSQLRETCAAPLSMGGLGLRNAVRTSPHRVGVLDRWGFVVESAGARICRKAGARVTTNMVVRDLDFPVLNARDECMLEIVADGLPMFGGVQLAADTTLVPPMHFDRTPQWKTVHNDGVGQLGTGKRRFTLSWLVQARFLVVLAGEIGGG